MQYRVEGVPTELVDVYWDAVSPMLSKALDPEIETIGDVRAALTEERSMLWVVRESEDGYLTGALVVSLLPDAVLVWLAGGRDLRGSLETAEHALMRYAKEHNRHKVVANVKPGLARMMPGWRVIQETVVLDGHEEDATPRDERAAHATA